ncbi:MULTISPECIES: radical SAM family heme chaperone HemW [Clostridium]|uniref:Heme chaperone HemW n=1 Tax=Clostridium cadaveris TaxID=1529 RepID=A0A1I2JFF5_9CLOT|nr:radical SAM family heme chaperone HemW [Clostridium cadaveris]MDU4951294.1 radical SAM family heme chaperone HemW [Clostridium sp.]MDM8310737.1 radical SAM family heme chaperone HemW [Clostridium cadaveris]MDY4948743.1 radical SAM family heme chaperone HemW [Clostridium cadaveris]NME63862.1 oxygen-independent coproporphyrinogen III oxidase [Clostridium cadaveris]NWK10469.1 oxygen-independent coproporphyrinogen III oxidase [Clostridium cadaveris]
MKGKSLYVHIPFCKQKCFYCDFPSFSGKETLINDYLNSLEKELDLRVGDTAINTIFIGGGTPTYLNLEALIKLKTIMKKVNLKSDGEFTVECNPGTLNEEKLKVLKDMGVNRLSIGLQAVQDRLLKEIGRIHSYKEFKENFILARNLGFNNINVDLMFALPDQSLEDLDETLKTIIDLKPEHISCYSLIVEEETVFYKLFDDGKLNLPNEDLEREMYLRALRILKQSGYNQYEISNFSKPGYECRHNIVYWSLYDYIGIGSGSHSYIDEKRISNYTSIEKYIKFMMENGNAIEEVFENSIKDDMEEFMFMGLRKIEGINKGEFKERFKKEIHEVYGEVISTHIKNKLLVEDEEKIYLTTYGIEVSNYVMKDFIL